MAPSPIVARQVRWERDVWGLLGSLRQPLIAALHGYVLGSGVEIALFCDIRIASTDAVFGMPEVALGIMPAAGGSQTLPRNIGVGRALQILSGCEYINSEEALRIGLVNKVVKREELVFVVEAIAKTIQSNSSLAVQYAKEAIKRGINLPLREGLVLEKRIAKTVMSLSGNESPINGALVS